MTGARSVSERTDRGAAAVASAGLVAGPAAAAKPAKAGQPKTQQVVKRNVAAKRAALAGGTPTVNVGGRTVVVALEATGAGVDGYSDDTRASLAKDWNVAIDYASAAIMEDDAKGADYFLNLGMGILNQMESNCAVLY